MDIRRLTIDSIRTGIRKREFSALELTAETLKFAERENHRTNAYLRLSSERALAQAAKVDALIASGEDAGALAGVPVAAKDVIVTKGVVTTCGSKMLETYVPPYDATAVERIESAGGILIGKTNCDEFAMGSSNENSAYGHVCNPVAPGRVPGGSSGGSAAVVAQGTAVVALGSDTGGSVRQPAAFCGVVGVCPSYGRVSRYGLVGFASSLDHIGPIARNVSDAATLLRVMAGRDVKDATSASAPVPDYTALLDGNVRGMKLGVPREYMKDATAETLSQIESAVERFRTLGCEVRDISLPSTGYAIDVYYVIATAEASSNLARFDGVRYGMRATLETGVTSGSLIDMYRATRGQGFGAEVKRRIMLGTYVLSHGYYDAYYVKAQKVRAMIAGDFNRAFEQVDAILSPVSPFPAFRLGEKVADPMQMYLSDIFTITGSLAGIPCMSVPCGVTSEGLPVGLQIMCKHFDEAPMFRIAHAFETSV
jgi:aspartyl-tRNA(Asn)/glutamyl-tRNA(Gln) amidotransferase subunit A